MVKIGNEKKTEEYEPLYPQGKNKFGKISCIFGILGIAFKFIPLPIPYIGAILAAIGIIFGILGRKRKGESKNILITGLIISIAAIVLSITCNERGTRTF